MLVRWGGFVKRGFLVATPVAWWAGERFTQRAAGRSSPRTSFGSRPRLLPLSRGQLAQAAAARIAPSMQAYHIAVESKHRVWGHLWTSDRNARPDPGTHPCAIFDLPVRGTEIRHIALSERGGKLSVVVLG